MAIWQWFDSEPVAGIMYGRKILIVATDRSVAIARHNGWVIVTDVPLSDWRWA